MTTYPAINFISDNARTQGETKQFLEDLLQLAKEAPGGQAQIELTIASNGTVVPTGAVHTIDTFEDDPTDFLNQMTPTNHPAGRMIHIRLANAGRITTIHHNNGGSGQLTMVAGVDKVMVAGQFLSFILVGTDWVEIHTPELLATVATPGIVERASVAEVRDPSIDGKFPTVKDLYDAFVVVPLTSTSNQIVFNLDDGIKFRHTATENTQLTNPSNLVIGKTWSFEWLQHASSPKTMSWGSFYTTAGKFAALPAVTATNSARDHFTMECLGTGKIMVTSILNHD